MQKYPVRTTHRTRLAVAALLPVAREAFGDALIENGVVVAKFGAIARLSAQPDGKELRIDLTMDPKVPAEVAEETVRRYNRFLEEATGFSAKERARRLRKSASASGD